MHQPLLKHHNVMWSVTLTYGDDAANYVTFENNYMNGATVTWKNNNAPSNNIAGVQSLTAEVRYNGINNVYNVPVKVYEYQYKFKNQSIVRL